VRATTTCSSIKTRDNDNPDRENDFAAKKIEWRTEFRSSALLVANSRIALNVFGPTATVGFAHDIVVAKPAPHPAYSQLTKALEAADTFQIIHQLFERRVSIDLPA
jgi:hypothetical protein